MRISIRLWAGLAVTLATIMVLANFSIAGGGASAAGSPTLAVPTAGSAVVNASAPLVSGLPEFPDNLTHFVYIVRENHVFDDYLGDCFSTINDTCNYGADYTAGGYHGGAAGSHVADVPFLHYWAQQGTVFDNMYSAIDPYSAQAHAYLFSADVNGASDSCASGGAEGTGSTTSWGVYNSSSVVGGSCAYSADSGSQNYPSDGTIFDRFTGPNVAQSKTTIPFLSIGDLAWELTSKGSCAESATGGIPGGLPGNSVALEYTSCGTSSGWWTNTTSGSINYMPPTVNPVTGYPQALFDCQYQCGTINPMSDQYAAYGFISYVAHYGLPTYTFVELFDDHPGPSCPGSGVTYDTCIQYNDQSMNLIVQDIFNSTSAYKSNTVVAISEDDTQNGQNGGDHINNGRRFPFVLVAPPSVMKTGNPNPASCGITSGKCGNVVHQTFNTSNVLSVMERVELNVNPNIMSTTFAKTTFPMALNDQLAEGNPLEPVWRCGDPRVPCNTGTSASPVLTTTAVSPNPVTATPGGTVALSASAKDQSGNSMTATFGWSVYPTGLGTFSSTISQTPTFTAGSAAGAGHICENATAGTPTVTLMACVLATVSSSLPTLSSVSVSPGPTASVQTSGTLPFVGSATTSAGGSVYPGSPATFAWTQSNALDGLLNVTSGTTDVSFVAGSTYGNVTICLNVTYSAKTVWSCSLLTISKASPLLTSGTITPLSISMSTGVAQTFWSQALDQYGKPYSPANYAWSVSPSGLGTLSTSGPGNSTVFTSGSTPQAGSLKVTITSGPQAPVILTASITVTSPLALTASFTQSPWHGTAPLAVNIAGSVAGGSGTGYTQSMSWGDGSSLTAGTGPAVSMSHTYTAAGQFTPSLTVTDSLGHTAQVSLGPIYVYSNSSSPPPLKVSASGTPLTGGAPLPVALTGGISGGKAPYAASWNFGDGNTGIGSDLTHTYNAVGTYFATFWVNDSAGATGSATLEVDATAAGAGSNFVISLVGGPTGGVAPLNVSFVASGYGGTAPYTFSWTWGDGTAGTSGASVAHSYTGTGTFSVKVTATDAAGNTATQSVTIVVTAAPTNTQGNGGTGPLGLPWTEWGLLIVVLALVGVLAVVLVSRRPKHPESYDEGAYGAGAPMEPSAGYAATPINPGPPQAVPAAQVMAPAQGMPPPRAAPSNYSPADDSRAPNPMG